MATAPADADDVPLRPGEVTDVVATPVPAAVLTHGWAPDDERDEATRYLCAAVHLDSALADDIAENVLEEPLRGVARSPGVDLVAVMRHVLFARARHLVRDTVLLATLVLWIVALFNLNFYLWAFVFVVAWLAVFVEACVARWAVVARMLRRGVFVPEKAPVPRRPLSREQVDLVRTYMSGNVTVYSDYEPFMGHGYTLDAWSLAVDVTRPATANAPAQPITCLELHDHLRRELAALDFPGLFVDDRLFVSGNDIRRSSALMMPDTQRPVARVPDDVMRALIATPHNRARPYLTVEIVGWGGEIVCTIFVRVLVTSTTLFLEGSYSILPPLRAAYHEVDTLRPRAQFGELVRLSVRSLFRLPGMTWHCLPRVYRQAFARRRRAAKARQQGREIRLFGIFNHGAVMSVRERAGDIRSRVPTTFPSLGPVLGPALSPVIRTILRLFRDDRLIGYQRYFQVLDKDMYLKAAEKRIFDAAAAFLRSRNISPAELVRRAETIINNSVHIGQQTNITNSTITGSAVNSSGAHVGGSTTG